MYNLYVQKPLRHYQAFHYQVFHKIVVVRRKYWEQKAGNSDEKCIALDSSMLKCYLQ